MSQTSLPSLSDMRSTRVSDLQCLLPGTRTSKFLATGSALAVAMAASVLASGSTSPVKAPRAPAIAASEASLNAASLAPTLKPETNPLKPELVSAILPVTALTAAMPFRHTGSSVDRNRATECLAAAAWYESGNDLVGQRAVAQTVINRVNHPSFPNSVCGVVFEGSERSTGCQFTFTCDGSLHRRRPSAAAWKAALTVADMALAGYVDTSVGTATHYHADYVSPWWSSKLQRLTKVGPHIFYRWAGSRGSFQNRTSLDAEQSLTRLSLATADNPGDNPDEGLLSQSAAAEGADTRDQLVAVGNPTSEPGLAAPLAPASNAIVLAVDSGQASGRWALAAMRACSGQATCQVLGYGSSAQAQANHAIRGAAKDRPLFLFVRDANTGMDIALWDCRRTSRPNADQCLPEGAAALRALMAERG